MLPTTRAVADTAASNQPGGSFVATQGRVLDTRNGTGGYTTPMPTNTKRSIQIAGKAGVPATGVAAVSITLTALTPGSSGSIYVTTTSGASLLSDNIYLGYDAGETVSNTAMVAMASDGTINVSASTSTDLLVDVQGYFNVADANSAGGYSAITPTRVADTRSGLGVAKQRLQTGQSITIPLGGTVDSSANSVFANVTVVSPATTGYVVVGGATNVSLNFNNSTSTAIGTTIPITGNSLTIRMGSGGPADIIVDIEGYFSPSSTTTGYRTAANGTSDYPSEMTQNVAANSTAAFKVAGVGDIPSVELGTTATVASLRVFAPAGSNGYINAWTASEPEPSTSVANYHPANSEVSNTVVFAPNPDGYITVANHGSADVTVELVPQGWFATPLVDDQDYEAMAASDTDLPDTIERADLYKYDMSQNTFGGGDAIENDASVNGVNQPDPDGVRSISPDARVADSIAGDPNEVWTFNGTEPMTFQTLQKVPSGYRLWGGSDANVSDTKYRTNQIIAYNYHCPSGKSYCVIDNEIAFYLKITLNGGDSKKWHFGTTKPRRIKGSTPYSGQYGYSCGVNVKNNPDHICVHGADLSGRSGKLNMSGTESYDTYKTFERRGTFGVNYAMIAVSVRFGSGKTTNQDKIRGWDVCVTRDLSEFCLDTGNGS